MKIIRQLTDDNELKTYSSSRRVSVKGVPFAHKWEVWGTGFSCNMKVKVLPPPGT